MTFVDTKYFKVVDENILFTGPYMELFVPGAYFKKDLAEQIGDTYKIFGIANFITYNDPDGKSPNPIRLLNIPVKIMTYPSGYDVRKMDLHSQNGEEPVVVLKYYTNDIFCEAYMPKVSINFKHFLQMLDGGKVPSFTPYDEVFNIWKKNMEISGINFDIPDSTYEIVIAERYRSRNNPQKKFGAVLAKDPNHDMTDYVSLSARELTKINSAFTGIIFEDMDMMLTSAVNKANTNKQESLSPMEEIIKY